MTARVPCSDCGAEILPATAEATGGVCMACKQGIRKQIEASKEYYRKQKEYDPYRELWISLVDKVHKTSAGFGGLSTDEQMYFAIGCLDGEVYNGGFHQYFFNSSGDYHFITTDGLLEIRAFQALKLLKAAEALLFDNSVPADCGERRSLIRNYSETDEPESWEAELGHLEDKYWNDPDQIGEKLDAFAADRGLLSPFLKQSGEQAVDTNRLHAPSRHDPL